MNTIDEIYARHDARLKALDEKYDPKIKRLERIGTALRVAQAVLCVAQAVLFLVCMVAMWMALRG